MRFRIAAALAALLCSPAVRAEDVIVKLGAGDGFEITDNTGAIDRLRIEEATGNVTRNGALFVHTTGTNNTFIGVDAGNSTTPSAGNTAVGQQALSSIATGWNNSAFGHTAMLSNTTGAQNSAFGSYALRSNTTGQGNVAFGRTALSNNIGGGYNAAFGTGALSTNTGGNENSAFGADALRFNTATANSAFGARALRFNSGGTRNSAFGHTALGSNTTGNYNSAFGAGALYSNTTGHYNTALGQGALLYNSTGHSNTSIGRDSMGLNTTGHSNVAIGASAGFNQTTGSDNIYIVNSGIPAENGQIKIGTAGTHTKTTIAGIRGATATGGISVLVDANGVLGTTASSARFKQNVRDMDHAGDALMKLRPVAFEYREDVVGAEDAKTTQYGLIAEEVAQVAPELVAPDLEGKPYSVKYHELPALLLSQVQAQQRTIDAQCAQIAELTTRLADVERRLAPAR